MIAILDGSNRRWLALKGRAGFRCRRVSGYPLFATWQLRDYSTREFVGFLVVGALTVSGGAEDIPAAAEAIGSLFLSS
jgi:hypothetical protein